VPVAPSTPGQSRSSTRSESWLHSFRGELQKAIDENRCREMSLKTLKDFIDKLYESKEAAASKLAQGTGNTAVETMEMHLYSTLEKKYGLRSIAAEQAGMVLIAVDKYASEDNFVNVFHKIFRNEVEDDFWLVQKELLKSIRDLAMVQLMSRYPTKDQPTLLALLDQKVADGLISEDEWTDMVNYLYNSVDSTAICLMLKKLAAEEMGTQGIIVPDDSASAQSTPFSPGRPRAALAAASPNTLSKQGLNTRTDMSRRLGYNSPSLKAQQQQQTQQLRESGKSSKTQLRLSFQAFQKCVLDFQLKSRLQYLATFRAAFERFDADFDGVLSAEEMRECYFWLRDTTDWLPPSQSNKGPDDDYLILSLLQVMDPRQTNRIPFSVAATTISKAAASALSSNS
jgi:Ca2+-binding EF-hand superfamily protein